MSGDNSMVMQEFIKELRKSASAVFLATEEDIAHDLSAKLNKAARLLEQLHQRCEVLACELDHERSRVDNAVKLLTGIHRLLYPAPITTTDGRTMVFRPKSLDPHEVLQELSDRIRALPDEIIKVS